MDIVVYLENKNWFYLVEVVYSLGVIFNVCLLEFKKLIEKCKVDIIFVIVFLDYYIFCKFVVDIVWEMEVWIVDVLDYIIYFNGEKFLGFYF